QTSQYGAMSRAIRFRNLPIKTKLKGILEEIESGKFTREWEGKLAKIKFRLIRSFATKTRINSLEQEVRRNLKMKEVAIFDEDHPSEEDLQKYQQIKEELEEFETFFQEF
ncbi:MAG: hypothetical protein ACFFBD_06005, partial [Candidatus Hodarchaeota archaeon]